MDNVLNSFMSKELDNEYNSKLLDKDYVFSESDFMYVVEHLCSVKETEFLEWTHQHIYNFSFGTEDIIQFSSLDNATKKICLVLLEHGDTGFRHIEIGKMLQNDGLSRTDNCNTKYGENHSKTASILGLLFAIKKYYYVSCFGRIINCLDDEKYNKLLIRLIIRTNLFRAIYLMSMNEGNINLRTVCSSISDKTYTRRKSNIATILDILKSSNDYDFSYLLNRIEY